MSTDFTVIIPARLGSTRLPQKALADIGGKPMIVRVMEQALRSGASRVVVATDSDEIEAAVSAAGGQACMTSSEHPSGTDRINEAAAAIGLPADAVVVNVQGDEPLIPPAVIDQIATLLDTSGARMASLFEVIDDEGDDANPNIVKVVTNDSDEALYFSRARIPFDRDGDSPADVCKRHLGIYAYRVSLLNDFVGWPESPLEKLEKLEQLRAMHHGVTIQMAEAASTIPPGVDTAEDLERVRAAIREKG